MSQYLVSFVGSVKDNSWHTNLISIPLVFHIIRILFWRFDNKKNRLTSTNPYIGYSIKVLYLVSEKPPLSQFSNFFTIRVEKGGEGTIIFKLTLVKTIKKYSCELVASSNLLSRLSFQLNYILSEKFCICQYFEAFVFFSFLV